MNTFLINRIFYPLQNPSGAPQSLFLCRNNSEEFGIVLHKSNWKLIDLNEYLLLLMSTWVVFILMFPFNIPRSWIKVATAASLQKSLKASTSSTLRTFTSSTWRKFLSAIVLWKVLVSSVPLEPERQKPHRWKGETKSVYGIFVYLYTSTLLIIFFVTYSNIEQNMCGMYSIYIVHIHMCRRIFASARWCHLSLNHWSRETR